MTTYSHFNPADWITQSDAARVRQVSRQAIAALIRRERLRTLEIAGYVLVHRQDVLDFARMTPGRRAKEQG